MSQTGFKFTALVALQMAKWKGLNSHKSSIHFQKCNLFREYEIPILENILKHSYLHLIAIYIKH